jgi:hypothetical protein
VKATRAEKFWLWVGGIIAIIALLWVADRLEAQKVASTNSQGPAGSLIGRNYPTNWLYVPVDSLGYLMVDGLGGGGGGGGSGTVNSGAQYLIPEYVTNPSGTTVGPSNIKTDSTGNNFIIPTSAVISWGTDTGLSRLSADTIGFGNGTANDISATIEAAAGTFSGTVSGGTGTFPTLTSATAFTTSGTFALASGAGGANQAILSGGTGQPLVWGTVPITVCNGAQALGTSAIASGAAATTITISCPGLTSASNIFLDFASSPLGVTGYAPSINGILTIFKWPSSGQINISVVNNTASSITPGAISVNYYGIP